MPEQAVLESDTAETRGHPPQHFRDDLVEEYLKDTNELDSLEKEK